MGYEETLAQEITAILVKDDVLSAATGKQIAKMFKDASQEQFADFMLDEAFVIKKDLLQALSQHYQVPWFDVEGYFFNHALLHQFPKDVLLRNNFIPLEVDQNILTVITNRPNNDDLLPLIGNHVSYDIRFHVGLKRHINNMVKEFYDEAITEVDEDDDLREERDLIKKEDKLEE